MRTAAIALGILLGVYASVLLMARRMAGLATRSRRVREAGIKLSARQAIWGFFAPYFALLGGGIALIAVSSGRGPEWVAGLLLMLTAVLFRFVSGWWLRKREADRMPADREF